MDEPAGSREARARTAPRVEQGGTDNHGRDGGTVLSRTPTSGAKGFAIILGAMLGIIGLLWLIAALVSPH
ncbi:MAG TPA: hypothetical protein VFU43_03260 [Streptosporangiaceae bacterium]|nr:hypothetical protein [Streptosporangiaceae bacterium]